MKKPSPASRSKARRFVLQALYQMSMTADSAVDVYAQFATNHDLKKVDKSYLQELLLSIDNQRQTLLDLIEPVLDRKLDELDPIEMAILLISSYELKSRIEVPYRVVINEGIELAKQFGASESHKLVNSVLDKLAKQLRQIEYAARSG